MAKKPTSRQDKTVKKSANRSISKKEGKPRPPVVTIMGHVDHGKTTLLDWIRKSKVTQGEAGGITQHIGAYQIEHKGKKITFIDTPGHAAFAKMRSRGAAVTDIVVLVVAATEGAKPQTVESIKHIKEAGVPFIVAINKMDLPTADAMNTKSELAKYDVVVEDFGGKVTSVEVSAKTGKNVDQLLEMIQLMAEVEGLTADPEGGLKATVIESHLDKHRGAVVSCLVQSGTLKVGQNLYADDVAFRVRTLINDKGQRVKAAYPSQAVEIGGLKELAQVGAVISEKSHEPTMIEHKPQPKTDERTRFEEELEALLEEKEIKEKPSIKLVLKTDVEGTLEAIKTNFPEEVEVVGAGVGSVNESDVMLAASSGATVVAFSTPVAKSAKMLAQAENVTIKSYRVIYELLEDVEKIILKLLEPTIDEEELGRAEIMEIFEIKDNRIAGCKVRTGEIKKTDLIHLVRGEDILMDVKIKSLQQAKQDVEKIKAKNECGIIMTPSSKFNKGDFLVAYKKIDS